MTGFEWEPFIEVDAPGCWIWIGPGAPKAREVWFDLVGTEVPRHQSLQRRCHVSACVNPDHMQPQNRAAMQRIAYVRRWGGTLPEWEGKPCLHAYCSSHGCPYC